MPSVSIRFRVDFGRSCAIGPGKVALLEAIRRTGSLSQAARELRISYRRAWLLLESLNTAFRGPVTTMSTGGKGGGGARLTPFGATIVSAYRKLETHLARRAEAALAGISAQVARSRPTIVRRRPLQKASAATRRRASVRSQR